jgi:fatty acid desaturase
LAAADFLVWIVAGFTKFQVSLLSKISAMFEFDQYLGFLAFLTILTIGFWLMMLLLMFIVPYWLGGNLIELLKERREAKKAKRNA